MGERTKIEYAHHTFNPWWGCVKVSDACKHCYAETMSRRFTPGLWGPNGRRRFFDEAHWQKPLRWHRRALRENRRRRVFCASMADLFERLPDGHADERRLEEARLRTFELVECTPKLDWMVFTKRPENALDMLPWTFSRVPRNLWVGATVEHQGVAAARLAPLLHLPVSLRFISAEPLLGRLVLSHVPLSNDRRLDTLTGIITDEIGQAVGRTGQLDWVIAGGESGAAARPTDPRWFRDLRDECQASRVPFYFKQWGAWRPSTQDARRVLEYDRISGRPRLAMVGKSKAGRKLDGREHNELPRQMSIASQVA